MDTPTVFRRTVVATSLLYVLLLAWPWIEFHLVSQEVADLLSWQGYGARLSPPLVLSWALALSFLVVAVGLYRFSPAARFWFLVLTVFGHFWSLFAGLTIGTAVTTTLQSLVTMGDGALIALAFTSPVRERFGPVERSTGVALPLTVLGLLAVVISLSVEGGRPPGWLGTAALLCQPVGLWLLMAFRRGVSMPDGLFPLRERWLEHLAWLLLLGGADIGLWEATMLDSNLPSGPGFVVWLLFEAVILAVSVAVFALIRRAVEHYQTLARLPLDDTERRSGFPDV